MTKADKEGQRKAPILRFKGFTDDWEQRKLGKVATFINGRAYKQNELLDSGKYKVLRVGNFYTNDSWYYSNLELADKYYIDKGDLVYTWSATFGPHIWDGEKVIYHYHIWKIELSKFLDRDFTLQILEADKAKLLANTNGSTMIHVTKKDMESKVISLPIIEEQKQIGLYLTKFDTLIALYERKTRLLGKVRTFLTQRLFSNSSKVSLYFDNKNWSEHKISEFLTERNEKVVPNSSIPLVSFTVEKGVTPKSKRYNREFLVKDDNKKYKITKKDDIVYNPANLKFGAIARNKFGNAAFSPIYVTFITKLNPAFTEFLVRRKNFINLALKYQEGTVYERMAVKSKDFLNLKIYLPNSSRDINHIAQILQSLDTLVSLNKNKVSLITLIKKELLNTMFI